VRDRRDIRVERAASATPLLSTSTMRTAVLRFSSDFMLSARVGWMTTGVARGIEKNKWGGPVPNSGKWRSGPGGRRWRGSRGGQAGSRCGLVRPALSQSACNRMCGRPGGSPHEPGRIGSFSHATSRQSAFSDRS